jgi:glutamate-1-semialdehyde 2,1-aminomutase
VVLKMEGSYHGHHDSVMVSVRPPLEQLGERGEPSSLPFGAGHPDAIRQLTKAIPFNDADALERALERYDVAAVILEPAMMNITIVAPREGYLQRVRELCDAHGAKLIFDEVKTGATIGRGRRGRALRRQARHGVPGEGDLRRLPGGAVGMTEELADEIARAECARSGRSTATRS